MKKIALVYITYDGIINTMCGVGIISRAFIDCFEEVRAYFYKFNIDISLHLITQALTNEALGYDREILNNSLRVTSKCNGGVHYILNGSNGNEQFGSVENWNLASCTAASKSLEISCNYDETIVIAVDTPFMYTPYYIDLQKKAYPNSNIKSILALHSDVLSHHPEEPDMSRLAWEASSIKYACIRNEIKIAKTSKFLTEHLVNHYAINEEKFINIQSGIDFNSLRYKHWKVRDIENKLKSYNIPLNKNIIFSVGRAVSYKGFDVLIKAFANLKKRDTHLVFIASPYKTAPSNVEELKSLLKEYKINCTAIFNLDLELPQAICQWKKTKIVAQLSRHEPFGLVPEEVRLWSSSGGAVILTSFCEGYIEQISDEIDGFTVDINDLENVSNKMKMILSLSESEINKIRRAGLKRVMDEYDYRVSMFKLFSDILDIKSSEKQFRGSLNYDNLF